jgi:hypothetical protein
MPEVFFPPFPGPGWKAVKGQPGMYQCHIKKLAGRKPKKRREKRVQNFLTTFFKEVYLPALVKIANSKKRMRNFYDRIKITAL